MWKMLARVVTPVASRICASCQSKVIESDVPLKDVPVQPAENSARAQYETLIATFADLPLAGDARYELAELYAQHGEYEPAIKILGEALDREPPADLTAAATTVPA